MCTFALPGVEPVRNCVPNGGGVSVSRDLRIALNYTDESEIRRFIVSSAPSATVTATVRQHYSADRRRSLLLTPKSRSFKAYFRSARCSLRRLHWVVRIGCVWHCSLFDNHRKVLETYTTRQANCIVVCLLTTLYLTQFARYCSWWLCVVNNLHKSR